MYIYIHMYVDIDIDIDIYIYIYILEDQLELASEAFSQSGSSQPGI